MSTYAQNAQSQSNPRSRGSQSGAQSASSSNPALATIETWLSMNRPDDVGHDRDQRPACSSTSRAPTTSGSSS